MIGKKINIIGFSIIALWCEVIGIVFFFDLEIANDDYELMYFFLRIYLCPFQEFYFYLFQFQKVIMPLLF